VKAVRGSASAVRISLSLVNHGRGLVDHAKPLRGINCACKISTSTNYYTSPYNLLKDANCTYQTYNSLHKPSLGGNCTRTTNHVEKAFQYIIGNCTSRTSTNCDKYSWSTVCACRTSLNWTYHTCTTFNKPLLGANCIYETSTSFQKLFQGTNCT